MSRDEDDWSDGLNSFDNIAWSPILDDGDDELPDDATRAEVLQLHSPCILNQSGRGFTTSTPRQTFAVHRRTPVSSRWLRYSSFHRYSGQDGASLLELGADNSQGYQHFYTDYRQQQARGLGFLLKYSHSYWNSADTM
ncbi:hypothetical protein Y032_0024g1072 [Ancylostoma ceylanicum]|uniref:Uncharacterized protein n=1 Tax=Ancylostoma ceylanicum TaxID=53326 RepID=A0A016UW24_9BILA|nr:hypothetical protein Y032_0024g1072 [Ancylostoma ceylanicum]